MVLIISAQVSGRIIVVMPDIVAVQGQFGLIRTKDLEARQSGKFPKRAPGLVPVRCRAGLERKRFRLKENRSKFAFTGRAGDAFGTQPAAGQNL
jgi:hypothetical protein